MQLPIPWTPTREDVVDFLVARRVALLVVAAGALVAAATVGVLWRLTASGAPDPRPGDAPLHVTSDPPGATVVLDGRPRGRTPLDLGVAPGGHALVLQGDGWIDEVRRLEVGPDGASLDAALWRRTPLVTRLRPTFPGAAIAGASFVDDGRVALLVAMPAGDARQLWLVDPAGGPERVGPPDASGPATVSPDGTLVAYAARGAGGASSRFDELRLAPAAGGHGRPRWRPGTTDEELADLTFTPDGGSLLAVTSGRPPGGGTSSRLLLMPVAGGEPRELVALPGEVVPGSYAWSPEGRRVAFLARAGGLTALCVADADPAGRAAFRYVADVGREDAAPLPFPPVAWSPDGTRLVYAAPLSDGSTGGGWLFGPPPSFGLYAADAARPVGKRLGQVEARAPLWRSDGALFAVARPDGDGPLALRALPPDGPPRAAGDLGLDPATAFAVRWDPAHAQALLVDRPSSTLGYGQPEYWLLRFRAGVDA